MTESTESAFTEDAELIGTEVFVLLLAAADLDSTADGDPMNACSASSRVGKDLNLAPLKPFVWRSQVAQSVKIPGWWPTQTT